VNKKQTEMDVNDFNLKVMKDIHINGHIIVSITHNGYQWSSISVTRNQLKQIGDRIFSFLTKNMEGK
jgi:hypothetical protein